MTDTERAYYEKRAAEYDDWYLGTGLFAQPIRPGWPEELKTLKAILATVHFRSFLDVACGTGFLTESLSGRVVGVDQSTSMLAIARTRLPGAELVRADALRLPFRSEQFDCLVTGHFYGHLNETDRGPFLTEARRVSRRIILIDAAVREGVQIEQHQERVLKDGSRHSVYKRYFTPAGLITELGTGRELHSGRWFVAVLA